MNLINSQLELTENSYFCFPKLRFESKEIWGFKGTSHEVICFVVYEKRLCKKIQGSISQKAVNTRGQHCNVNLYVIDIAMLPTQTFGGKQFYCKMSRDLEVTNKNAYCFVKISCLYIMPLLMYLQIKRKACSFYIICLFAFLTVCFLPVLSLNFKNLSLDLVGHQRSPVLGCKANSTCKSQDAKTTNTQTWWTFTLQSSVQPVNTAVSL